MKRRAKPPTLSMIERAMIEQRWHRTFIDADLAALISDNGDAMVHHAGSIFYVVMGACMAEEAGEDDPAIVTLADAIDAAHEQVGEPAVEPGRRARIAAGLEVCRFLLTVLDRSNIISAACDLVLKMKAQHITHNDFKALQRGKAA